MTYFNARNNRVSYAFGTLVRQGAAILSLLCMSSLGFLYTAAQAQTIDFTFPQGQYGYDQQLGVTVLTRSRTPYDPLGIQVDNFLISPSLNQSLFYNSNVNGGSGSGSWGSHTTGSASVRSGWSRDSVSASLSFDNLRFFSLPVDNYTDWSLGLSAGYSIADSQVVAAYSHQSYHQLGTSIGVLRSDTPLLDQVDTARLEYTFNFGRISLTPDLSFGLYQYGPATVAGAHVSQAFLDNDAVAAGITARYAVNQESGILLVTRGSNIAYTNPLAGQPSNDSNTFQLLAGIDYQPESVWRYRLLVGVQVRAFVAAQYGMRTAPDVEGSVIWSPTGLTTVTGSLANSIQSPQTAGTNSYTLTQLHLSADHEYRRNIILNGHGGLQYAQFDQLGTQTSINVGVAATWLLDRNVRLSWGYDYTKQSGSGGSANNTRGPESSLTSQYSQQLITLTLRLAL